MQIKKTIAVGTVSLAALLAGGAAVAAGHGSAPTSADSEATTGVDTDNVQQGDQTSPEMSGAVRSAGSGTTTTASGTAPSGSSETGSETETDTESEGSSDGPGGHEDPPGNVDHQFQGEE